MNYLIFLNILFKMSKEINPFYQEIFDNACIKNDKELVEQFMDKVDITNGFSFVSTKVAQNKNYKDIMEILTDEIDRREIQKKRKFKILLVKYNVQGHDHDGYCSGNEIDEKSRPSNWFHTEIIKTDKYNDEDFILNNFCQEQTTNTKKMLKPEYLSDFNEDRYDRYGCTSTGSGHCKGMWQKYTPSKIYWIKNIIHKSL
jgi:hypothetical protein